LLLGIFLLALAAPFSSVKAAELIQDNITIVKAKVVQVLSSETKTIPGLDIPSQTQSIEAEILEGNSTGKTVTFDNDYTQLKKGDIFYLNYTIRAEDGSESFSVEDVDRLPTLYFFGALFILLVLLIGGWQGMRGLITLGGSFVLILFVLLPGILHGYSPIVMSIGVASLIIVVGSYITHGFNRTTTAAVIGMIITVIITGLLAYAAVHSAKFSGYGSEEAVYLNLNARGHIDLIGILLGGIMIGLLGVLYDVAIGQAISVEELHHIAPHIPRRTIYKRAIRMGREHIGALVNTLAIAYVGASLPLLLLFSTPPVNVALSLNREIFAGEIIRALIGSIGLVLAVPITTLLAIFMLIKIKKIKEASVLREEKKALEQYVHHH